MAAYSTALDVFVAACRRAAGFQRPPPAFYESATQYPFGHIFELLVLAPFFETFFLVAIVELVRRFHAPPIIQALTGALFISGLHSWGWWPHGLIVLPAFCIDAAAYLYWRRKSWRVGYIIAALIHVLGNLIPAIMQLGYALRTG
jgi:hypothetical protein